MVTIPVDRMERLSRELFEAAGATSEDAAVTTAILVRTSL